jgi:hypothetical protein
MLSDIAELIRGTPHWDWDETLGQAKSAGCLRMVLISVLLATELLDAPVPSSVRTRALADPKVMKAARRIARHLAIADEKKTKPSSIFSLTAFQLNQFDRRSDRFSYALRTSLRPRLAHVAFLPLPPRLVGLYPVVKIVHDWILMPFWHGTKLLVRGRPERHGM